MQKEITPIKRQEPASERCTTEMNIKTASPVKTRGGTIYTTDKK